MATNAASSLTKKADSINAVKMLLPRCWMDKAKTERLRDCAVYYHADYNDRMGVFKTEPVHDWSSHAVDALATLALERLARRAAATHQQRDHRAAVPAQPHTALRGARRTPAG